MHTTLAPKKSKAATKNGSGPAASNPANTNGSDRTIQSGSIGDAIKSIDKTLKESARRAGMPEQRLRKLPASEQVALANGAGYQLIARSRIGRSPFNRDTFDQTDLEKLAADLKIRGILQPLVVRPNPRYKVDADGNAFAISTETEGTRVRSGLSRSQAADLLAELNAPDFELIAGERRWRAAGIGKLADLPVIVRPATDREAIEDQAVENMQREDLNPIHEGEKYQQLLDVYKRLENLTSEQAFARIEEKLHVGKSTIYSRMRLLKLPEAAKSAALSGRLPASHAEEIAKLDDPQAQEEVTARILKPTKDELGDDNEDPRNRPVSLMGKCTVMGFRHVKKLIVAKQEELKNRAAYNKVKAEFDKKGLPVLPEKENAEAFNQWGGLTDKTYVSQDGHFYLDGISVSGTYKRHLGKDAPPSILGQSPDGRPVLMYRKSIAEAILRKKFPEKKGKSSRPDSEVQRERAHKERSKAFLSLLGPVAESAESNDSPEVWRFVAFKAINLGVADAVWREVKRRFPETKKPDAYDVLKKFVSTGTGKQIRGVVAELFFATYSPSLYSSGWGDSFAPACELFGVTAPAWEVQTSGKEEQI